jgi:hypothetical protein
MAGITRGTTPNIVVTVPMDLTGYTCFLSIGKVPGEPYFTVGNEQMTAEYGEVTKLTCTLTQEQTLACSAGSAYIQLRIVDDGAALASVMAVIEVLDVIQGGVIVDVN